MPTKSLNTIQTWEKETIESLWKMPPIVDLAPVEAVDCETTQLPSAEDYQKQDRDYTQSYWELQSRKWSEPKYRCPACNEGGMRRDETVVLASNPPSYRYECDKCHHTTYHHI